VFVYHSEYEQIITNIYHGEDELDDFVVKMAQRSGKGISKRRPQVDATLPDGSRAQLTLGKEVSDHGTNYTIRQFQDVPHTPIDLINWNTFSLDEMAFLWLCIENHKSLIFAGGTASGKTTSLNAVSLFIPSTTKVVSIEDTREVELPQRNWIASVTRQSFTDDSGGGVDEFDLLEAALRQRPDYIVMGEVRGEEGRDLFQVMSTGHTSYSTFHADTVGEVLKRFTTDPINVSKTMFTALDLVSIQTQTRVGGHKVRRNKKLTEVNHYDAETDEINVQDVYQWQAETDEFLMMGDSNTLEEIKFDRGWNQEKLEGELFKRRVIIAYLIKNGLNEYTEVAATVQAFINDPDTIMTLVANGQLEESLEDLQEMESILLDVDPEKEELVPRPDPPDEIYNEATDILERAEESLFDEFRGQIPAGLASALSGVDQEAQAQAQAAVEESDGEMDFGGAFEDEAAEGFDVEPGDEFGFSGSTGEDEVADEGPDWLSDEGGFDFGEDDDSADAGAEAATASADATDATDAASGSTDAPGTAPPDTEETPPALEADASGAATETSSADAGGTDAEAAANGGVDAAGASTTVDDGPDQPELESGAPGASGSSADDPIFSEPDDTAESESESLGGDEGFFDDSDAFDDGGDDAESIFSEEETVSSGGGGMFGTAEGETGDDLLEEAGDLFGGDGEAESGDTSDDGAPDSSEESAADADSTEEPSDQPAPSEETTARDVTPESDATAETDTDSVSASEADTESASAIEPVSEESTDDADAASEGSVDDGGPFDGGDDESAGDGGIFDDEGGDETAEDADDGIFGETDGADGADEADDADGDGFFGDEGDDASAPDSDEERGIFSEDGDDESAGDGGIFDDEGGDEADEDADDGIFGNEGGDEE
jgi:flagellar protein FlaI